MPQITYDYCDECNKEMGYDEQFLIYSIDFWDKTLYDSVKIDYIEDRGSALMLCSKKCIGEYIGKLIENKEDDKE